MRYIHTLTDSEAKLLDDFLLRNLENWNRSMNRPKTDFTEAHFFSAIDTCFPNWRSEQLANITDNSYSNTNIAYTKYMERFNE